MRDHIRILGILNMVMGCLTALGGVVVLLVTGGASKMIAASLSANNPDLTDVAPLIASIGIGIALFLMLLAAPSIIGGWGLLKFRPWSRIVMIVLSLLHLVHIPLGTALGVYGLWVLFSDEGRRLLQGGHGTFQQLPGSAAYSMAPPPPHANSPAPPPR